jgi:outer membrane protein assembly factor BamB
MARDPDQDSPIVFDLVDDDAADLAAPPAPPHTGGADGVGGSYGAAPGSGEPPVPAAQGGRWRAAAPVAAVLAIVLGTGIAADGARDNARIERMRDVHGGVADLSVPLEELWAWEGAVGADHEWFFAPEAVAVLDDVLAFESDGELVALEPATGEEAWAVPLGDDPDCGPLGVSAYSGTPVTSTSVVVCVQGSGADREAIAVTPDGTVSAPRALDPADTRRFGAPRPGPDGTVLRATRVGPESAVNLGNARCDDSGGCGGTVVGGRDVELRAEDAVTGEERWSVTVPFRPADAGQCWGLSWEDPNYVMDFDGQVAPDSFGGRIATDLVHLDGCGIDAAVTPDGVVLGTEFDPGMGDVTALEAGGYAGLDYGGAARTVLYSGDGDVVGEFPGYVLGPWVADGSGPATLLGTEETGQRLHAYEADGTPRWDVRAPGSDQPFLAQVGQTAVVTSGGADVRGIDVATGAERWRGAGESGDGVLQVFTDGQAVLLLLTQGDSGAVRMVSLDAASGELLWTSSDSATADANGREFPAALVAVDGHLLEVDANGVRGLG